MNGVRGREKRFERKDSKEREDEFIIKWNVVKL